jgi:hypothetical protein
MWNILQWHDLKKYVKYKWGARFQILNGGDYKDKGNTFLRNVGKQVTELYIFAVYNNPHYLYIIRVNKNYEAWCLQTTKYPETRNSALRLVLHASEYVDLADTRHAIRSKLYVRKINILTNLPNPFGRKWDHFVSVLRQSCRQFLSEVHAVFRLPSVKENYRVLFRFDSVTIFSIRLIDFLYSNLLSE